MPPFYAIHNSHLEWLATFLMKPWNADKRWGLSQGSLCPLLNGYRLSAGVGGQGVGRDSFMVASRALIWPLILKASLKSLG